MSLRDNNKHANGYIAIVSAVIITIVILTIVVSFSSSNFLGRFDSGFFEVKDSTRAIAEGCIEKALLELSNDEAYTGNESVSVASSTCTIRPILSGAGTKTIQTSATISDKTTNLELVVDEATFEAISFEEVSSF